MLFLLLPVVIYLAIKKPFSLYRCLFFAVLVLLATFLLEGVLGILTIRQSELKTWHGIISHFLVMYNLSIFMISVPAVLTFAIRQKDYFSFRRMPTGILVFGSILFVTFTAYLNPHNPQQTTATLRYVIFHHYFAPGLALIFVIRWVLLLKKIVQSAKVLKL